MMFVHFCVKCGHRRNWHREPLCCHGACKCPNPQYDPLPRLAPTYRNDRVNLADNIETRIIAPGEAMNPHCPKFSHRVAACDCDACQDAYRKTIT